MEVSILKKIGFSDKLIKVYLILLSLGPSSVRKLAEKTELNRTTVYDLLKELQEKELVNFYKKATKQYFVAENPEKLKNLLQKKSEELKQAEQNLNKTILELKALYNQGDIRPVARYYSQKEISKILEDVLETCEKSENKEYCIYSVEGIKQFLYKDFPTFSDVRISKDIKVKVISIGQGGELRGLDERKWLDENNNKQETYIILYSGKTAYISLNFQDEPIGVVIENQGIYETQKNIFYNLWKKI